MTCSLTIIERRGSNNIKIYVTKFNTPPKHDTGSSEISKSSSSPTSSYIYKYILQYIPVYITVL